MNNIKTLLVLHSLAAALTLCAVPASAQLNVTFAPAATVFSGAADQTATFTATLINNYAFPLYLNGDFFDGPDAPLTVDDTAFQTNVNLTPIAAGDTLTADLFTVTVPANTPMSSFNGTFYLTGGQSPNDNDTLSATPFAVSAQAVPEASTAVTLGLLLALSLGAVAWQARKRSAFS